MTAAGSLNLPNPSLLLRGLLDLDPDTPDRRYRFPILKDEIEEYLEDPRKWMSTTCVCPKPMYMAEKSSQEEKSKTLQLLTEGNQKWRILGNQFPRIYPSEKDWVDAPTEY